jgi:hypothetical protein
MHPINSQLVDLPAIVALANVRNGSKTDCRGDQRVSPLSPRKWTLSATAQALKDSRRQVVIGIATLDLSSLAPSCPAAAAAGDPDDEQ